jgi:hypothetical protein
MQEKFILWAVLIVSTIHGVNHYTSTGLIDIMALVFVIVPLVGLTAKE